MTHTNNTWKSYQNNRRRVFLFWYTWRQLTVERSDIDQNRKFSIPVQKRLSTHFSLWNDLPSSMFESKFKDISLRIVSFASILSLYHQKTRRKHLLVTSKTTRKMWSSINSWVYQLRLAKCFHFKAKLNTEKPKKSNTSKSWVVFTWFWKSLTWFECLYISIIHEICGRLLSSFSSSF